MFAFRRQMHARARFRMPAEEFPEHGFLHPDILREHAHVDPVHRRHAVLLGSTPRMIVRNRGDAVSAGEGQGDEDLVLAKEG